MTKDPKHPYRPGGERRPMTEQTKLDNVSRAVQENFWHLNRQMQAFAEAHNALVDDVEALKNFIEQSLDITDKFEIDEPDVDAGGP